MSGDHKCPCCSWHFDTEDELEEHLDYMGEVGLI